MGQPWFTSWTKFHRYCRSRAGTLLFGINWQMAQKVANSNIKDQRVGSGKEKNILQHCRRMFFLKPQ